MFRRKSSLRPIVLAFLCCSWAIPSLAAKPAAPAHPERQQTEVLFLSFSDPDLPRVASLIEEAETRILEGRATPVHFTLEYLNPSLLEESSSRKKMVLSFLREKHQGKTFDLIITINEQLPALPETSLARFFPNTAFLFSALTPADTRKWPPPKLGRAGVLRKLNFVPTLELALRQNPGTRQVVVIAGSSDFEKFEIKVAAEQFHSYEQNLEFQYWTDLTLANMRSKLVTLPPDSIVLFLDFLADANGEHFIPSRILPSISAGAGRPIYGALAAFVGNGVVGGSVADTRDVGRILGQNAGRILNGEKPEAVGVATGEFQHNVFDWRELHRWSIPEDQLPQGSSVLNWEYSSWEMYRWRVVALSAAVVIETLLIFLLLSSRRRRTQAEEALRQNKGELSEARLKHAAVVESSDDAIILVNLDGTIASWNSGAQRIFGFNESEAVGQPITVIVPSQLHDEDNLILHRVQSGNRLEHYETVRVNKAGKEVYVSLTVSPVKDLTGRIVGISQIGRDITENRRAAEQLKKSEEMFAKAFRQGPMAITLTDTKSHRYIDVNETFERFTGYSREELIGNSALEIGLWPDPSERVKFVRRLLAEGRLRDVELQFLTKDGRTRVAEASSELIEINNQPCVLTVAIDITERQKAEGALRESEKRFRLMADSAPVLMWLSGAEKLCTDFNKEWLSFTGRTMEQELGEGWTDNVHPDDLQSCLLTYTNAFDARQAFTMEYRLRRHDGQYRWMLDRGIPRFLEHREFAGFIGCCVDITDQKDAKTAQAELGGRLIQAQEAERARIARDLHDDINQRLALLANGLHELGQTTAGRNGSESKKQLTDLWQLTNEISTDIQHLSHQLHPSKLHYLGLAAAVRDLCHEFSKLHSVEVECVVRDLPGDLDENASLSLFRIVQESLHNVAKHSSARHAKVELFRRSTTILLRVSDDGIGFDTRHKPNGQGLGLVSMQERLKLSGGTLMVWSRPSLGTQVEATIPMVESHASIA